MSALNKSQLKQALDDTWSRRHELSHEELSASINDIYSRFEMRLDDLIEHLIEIREEKGNIKVLKEQLYSGTLSLANIHVQQRNDSDDQWVVAIY